MYIHLQIFFQNFWGAMLPSVPTWLCHYYPQQASLKKELEGVSCYLELEGLKYIRDMDLEGS